MLRHISSEASSITVAKPTAEILKSQLATLLTKYQDVKSKCVAAQHSSTASSILIFSCGVASMSRLLAIIGLFCRISSLL